MSGHFGVTVRLYVVQEFNSGHDNVLITSVTEVEPPVSVCILSIVPVKTISIAMVSEILNFISEIRVFCSFIFDGQSLLRPVL